jgi:hypothetical protein
MILIIMFVTSSSPPELVKHLREEDLVHRHVRSQEEMFMRCDHASNKLGRLIEKQVVIMDMAGLSMKPESIGMRVFRRVLNIDGNFYPGKSGIPSSHSPCLPTYVSVCIANWRQ